MSKEPEEDEKKIISGGANIPGHSNAGLKKEGCLRRGGEWDFGHRKADCPSVVFKIGLSGTDVRL